MRCGFLSKYYLSGFHAIKILVKIIQCSRYMASIESPLRDVSETVCFRYDKFTLHIWAGVVATCIRGWRRRGREEGEVGVITPGPETISEGVVRASVTPSNTGGEINDSLTWCRFMHATHQLTDSSGSFFSLSHSVCFAVVRMSINCVVNVIDEAYLGTESMMHLLL